MSDHTQQDQNTWQSGERTKSQEFSAGESQKNRDFNQSERTESQKFAESQRVAAEAFQSKENAKSRAQNFLAQQVSSAGKKFTAGQDYTGGAASAYGGSFNPNGRSRKKIDYSFKR